MKPANPWGEGKVKRTNRQVLNTEHGSRVIWVNKKPEKILDCSCGAKYIKTRWGQKRCLLQKHV